MYCAKWDIPAYHLVGSLNEHAHAELGAVVAVSDDERARHGVEPTLGRRLAQDDQTVDAVRRAEAEHGFRASRVRGERGFQWRVQGRRG